MIAIIEASLVRCGLSARLALAPTVGCAWAVARFGPDRIAIVAPDRIREALAPLPITGLRIDPTFVAALHEIGVEQIGMLFDLPREELACRWGADLLRRLDQATGQSPETVTPIRPTTPLEAIRIFDGPVTSLEAIVATVRELLFSLVLQLEERGCGVRTLEAVFQRVSDEPRHCLIALTHPSRDVRHLWTLLRPKIERIHFGYGVESIGLHASRIGKLFPHQLRWGPQPADESHEDHAVLGEFMDRLMDRFGSRAVRGVSAVETHVPEAAFPLGTWSETQAKSAPQRDHPAADGAAGADRPSQLFDVPEPAQVISLVPDGPPSWMRWRGRECAVCCRCGPERLALPWWESGGGMRSFDRLETRSHATRDYYEVQDDQGRLLWVFRDHVTNGWFVHGLWA
jgi:protein ImuB